MFRAQVFGFRYKSEFLVHLHKALYEIDKRLPLIAPPLRLSLHGEEPETKQQATGKPHDLSEIALECWSPSDKEGT